ncbi:MAG: DUF421 domain-containing protein [Clostridiaceae bacterium]|nr:DUF421 domain-containing protein [Clostridiaceae bacterium]
MFTVLIRTIILYTLVLFTMRIMGKRQIGQLEPFELSITIMISELASLPMTDTQIPLINGIIPIITLLLLEVFLAAVQLKYEKTRGIITGKPSIVISKGTINIQELKNQQLNLNDLFEELRLKGYFDIQDIQYAVLETSGQISVLPKIKTTPATKENLKINEKESLLPVTLILDGKINKESLDYLHKTEKWLMEQLDKHQIASVENIFLACIDSKEKFYYQNKIEKKVKP